jgi:type II restriction/modification system DNA methylase subunit YeeA
MNKSALKSFATSARKELLKKVEAKAMKIGVTEDNIKKAEIESSDAIYIDGKQLSKEEKVQRDRLIDRINQIGFKWVMEEVAYTWFNRFTALRYMEVNEYLPTDVRVLSSTNPDSADPDMINEALSLDLEIDKEFVYELRLNNKTEELFKYLIIKHCNDLNRYLPFMFETIDDYTEILFPEGLLAKDSFIREMTDTDIIPEDNWRKVEIIGWLYQYYISEEKDRVIKAKKKYKTEEIPFATQLFTPDWIVRYMVQNSLGRHWIESHTEHRDLLNDWEFYLENTNLDSEFNEKIAPYINKDLKVEDIKCFDPAMGSGHVLVYMFDVLYEIYSKCGYMEKEIPRLIIEKNLYGLDVDDRAYQLACFSIVMKALEYNERFFRSIEREGLSLNLCSIKETNSLDYEDIIYLAGENKGTNFEIIHRFINQFNNAKTIGSLIKIKEPNTKIIEEKLCYLQKEPAKNLFEQETRSKLLDLIPDLLKQSEIMSNMFDILVTNPPYMGNNYMTQSLSEYIKIEYPNTKSELFSTFIDWGFSKVKTNGQLAYMSPFVWMFTSSYEYLRKKIIEEKSISSLVQLEYSAFEEATVPICTFTLRNYNVPLPGEYIQLSEFRGAKIQPIKTLEAISNPHVNYRYSQYNTEFKKIPSYPIAFGASHNLLEAFEIAMPTGLLAEPKAGMSTGDNNIFQREWYEVEINKIGFNYSSVTQTKDGIHKWFPCNSGGSYRKWYGNNEKVVNWQNDGYEIRNFKGADGKLKSAPRNTNFFFKEGLTWTKISSGKFAVRYKEKGFVFDDTGRSAFTNDIDLNKIIIGLFCSKVTFYIMKLLNPTLSFTNNDIYRVPFIYEDILTYKKEIVKLVEENIKLSKIEWDSYETSWGFVKHPLIQNDKEQNLIEDAFNSYFYQTKKLFEDIKENESKINKIFIDIYKLNNTINQEIDDSDITVRAVNIEKEVKSFISYAIGCIFGRYSLDEDGLIYAGGEFNFNKYKSIKVDVDNILPILPGSYFEDDIVSRFINFVEITFGKANLTKNIDFIANSLGEKKGETAKETIRRYLLNDFFKDHVQKYKKRPIYWLFTSGKQKAFNCLIYMHRYDKTTLSRIRTDYLHEYQNRLDAERKSLVSIIEGDSTTKEVSYAKKELKELDRKIEELKGYDELLHHMADMQIEIDLDDGVAVNYEKFKGLVAKI